MRIDHNHLVPGRGANRCIQHPLVMVGLAVAVWACTPAAPAPAGPAAISAPHGAEQGADRFDDRCALPSQATVLAQDGAAILQVWEMPASEVMFAALLPNDPAYRQFRATVRQANADEMHPVAERPAVLTDEQRALWRLEDHNVELAYSGRAGRIRPIQCLEALFFAYQNARYSELTRPTEFLVSVLRKEVAGTEMLKAYFTASDVLFPPKELYGFDRVAADVDRGWQFWFSLHNHTVQQGRGLALGVPAPSSSDIQLYRSLAEDSGLTSARVTNGFYTIEIAADDFGAYVVRE